MFIPKFLQSALYSYNLNSLDIKKDAGLIITQVLNHGNWRQVYWAQKTYGLDKIKKVVKNPQRGMWHEDVLNYWGTIFNLRLPKSKNQKAIFSLSPSYRKIRINTR